MLSHAQLSTLTIRTAQAADARALSDLAQLDSAPPLDGDVLVAETDARPLAAIDVISGRLVADPFRRSSSEAALLRARAEQLRGGARHGLLGRLGVAR